MKIAKYLVLSLSLGVVVGLNNEMRMILDVIESYDKPTAVITGVCWTMSEKRILVTELMKTKTATTIQFTNTAIQNFAAENTLIIIDLKCEDSKLILQYAENNKFGKTYRWMLLTERETSGLPHEVRNLPILIDSEVLLAQEFQNDTIILNYIYKIDPSSEFIREPFGIWTPHTRLVLSKDTKIASSMRRKNLKGKPIVQSLVIVDEKTKTDIFDLNNVVRDNVAKSSFHNILPLYAFMNATPELIFTDTWGYYINNSWNGMIGQLVRKEADLCGTIIFMRANRLEALSFFANPILISAAFVFKEPPLSLQNNLYSLPFKGTVWICSGALIVVLVFVIYANARWEKEKMQGTKYEDPTTLRPDVSDIAIFVAGAVTQQGSNNEFKGSLGRIVTFIMCLIFLFLYTSYSANIVALLQSSSNQIRTLSDLLNSKLELGVEDQPYTRHYFSTATDNVRKAIYDNKVARTGFKPNFMSLEEGVKKLQNTDAPFAFHMNLGMGYKFVEQYFLEHEKCGLREIEYIPSGKPWVCCRHGSPYMEIYKIGLARSIEHGIGDRINRLIYARKPSCNARGGNFGSVNMVDFHPVLLCLLYGMVASVLILVIEIIVYRRQQRSQAGRHSQERINTWDFVQEIL